MTELALPLSVPSTTAPARWHATVVCGVNSTRQGREAVRQAAAVVAPDGRLELHMVTRGQGFDADPAAVLPNALKLARELGVDAEVRAGVGATVAAGLITAAAGADLLVVGCDALGPTPKAVLRHARCSVLLARRPPDRPFGESVVIDEACPPSVRELAVQLAPEQQSAPEAMLPVAAEATGSGLIVTTDRSSAIQLSRLASIASANAIQAAARSADERAAHASLSARSRRARSGCRRGSA